MPHLRISNEHHNIYFSEKIENYQYLKVEKKAPYLELWLQPFFLLYLSFNPCHAE